MGWWAWWVRGRMIKWIEPNQRCMKMLIFEDFSRILWAWKGSWDWNNHETSGERLQGDKGVCVEFSSVVKVQNRQTNGKGGCERWRVCVQFSRLKNSWHPRKFLLLKKGLGKRWWSCEGLKVDVEVQGKDQGVSGPITCWKMGWGCKDGRTMSVYSWWYRVKKHLKENKMGVVKKLPTYLHIQIAGGTHWVGYTKWNVNTSVSSSLSLRSLSKPSLEIISRAAT